MEPMTMALIAGAVMGMAKGNEQANQYKHMANAESIKERYAPFTGRRGQMVKQPSRMDPMLQSMLTAAMIGQQFGKSAPADAPAGGPEVPTNVSPGGYAPHPPMMAAANNPQGGYDPYMASWRPQG